MARNFKIKYCVMRHNPFPIHLVGQPAQPDEDVFESDYDYLARKWIADKLDQVERDRQPGEQSIRHEYYIREVWTNDTN